MKSYYPTPKVVASKCMTYVDFVIGDTIFVYLFPDVRRELVASVQTYTEYDISCSMVPAN